MARKDIINMSVEEVRRVAVIRQAIDGVITQKKAAEMTRGIAEAGKEADKEGKGRRRQRYYPPVEGQAE